MVSGGGGGGGAAVFFAQPQPKTSAARVKATEAFRFTFEMISQNIRGITVAKSPLHSLTAGFGVNECNRLIATVLLRIVPKRAAYVAYNSRGGWNLWSSPKERSTK